MNRDEVDTQIKEAMHGLRQKIAKDVDGPGEDIDDLRTLACLDMILRMPDEEDDDGEA